MRTSTRSWIGTSLGLLLAACGGGGGGGGGSPTPPAPTGYTDSFATGLDPAYWTVVQTTPGLFSVDTTQGDVRFARVGVSPGGNQSVRAVLNLAALGGNIAGDFSFEVAFSNAVLGPSIDQVELQAYFADATFFFNVHDNSGAGRNNHVWIGSIQGYTPTTADSGIFRIRRTGTTVTGSINGNPLFSQSNAAALSGIQFLLQLQPGSNDATSVIFDNFSLTIGP